MTLGELDKLLASWKADMDDVGAKLNGLEASAAYQKSKDKDMPLVGTTKKQIDEMIATIDLLWKYRKLLNEVLTKAGAKRQDMPRFWNGYAIEEIEKLLTTDPITLEVAAGDERALFGGTAVKAKTITPPELKKVMIQAYVRAFDVAENVRKRLLELTAVFGEYERKLESMKATIGSNPAPSEVSAFRGQYEPMSTRRYTDPLSLQSEEVRRQLEFYAHKAQLSVQALEREQEMAAGDVKKAENRLSEVKFAHGEANRAYLSACEKISNPALLQKPEALTALEEGLKALQTAAQEKRFQEVVQQLVSWNRLAVRLETTYKDSTAANAKVLQKVRALELRWKEDWLKFERDQEKGLEDDGALANFARKVKELLAAEKTDIEGLETILDSFESRMANVLEEFARRPPPSRQEQLRTRLKRASKQAETAGVASDAGLTKFADKARMALDAGDLETADTMITSYETRLVNHTGNAVPPATTVSPSTPAPPAVTVAPPKPVVTSAKEVLTERLEAAEAKARKAGLETQPALVKFAEKARTFLNANAMDGAESMVSSYETKLANQIGNQAATSPAVVSQPLPASTPSAPSAAKSRKEQLRDRLAAAEARARQAGVETQPALAKFAEKAKAFLASGSLDDAEGMVSSYETKLGNQVTAPAGGGGAPSVVTAGSGSATPKTRQQVLAERLSAAEAKARGAGLQQQPALLKFAEKARGFLESADTDSAESMIYSYETKLNGSLPAGSH